MSLRCEELGFCQFLHLENKGEREDEWHVLKLKLSEYEYGTTDGCKWVLLDGECG